MAKLKALNPKIKTKTATLKTKGNAKALNPMIMIKTKTKRATLKVKAKNKRSNFKAMPSTRQLTSSPRSIQQSCKGTETKDSKFLPRGGQVTCSRSHITAGYCRWLEIITDLGASWIMNTFSFLSVRADTYCTVSSLHLQQPHKTTIFDRELTANNYRNILDI